MVSEEEHSVSEDAEVEDTNTEGPQDGTGSNQQEQQPHPSTQPDVPDSTELIKNRSRARAKFTRQVTRIEKAIAEGVNSEVFADMQTKLAEHFEECIDLHLIYCAATKRNDDSWITALEADNNKAYDRMRKFLDKGETSSRTTINSSKAEDECLAKLAQELQEEKRRVKARREERRIEDELARLRWIDSLDSKPVVAFRPSCPPPWQYLGASPFTCKKPFDGDPREWPLFISRFKALVHDAALSDTQRSAILADWIGPSVHRRIATLLTAPRGYAAALDYLKQKYGAKKGIARCQLRDVLKLPACKPGDLQALETFADRLHGAVVVLEQGGHFSDLKCVAVMDQVVEKLPVAVRYRWARYSRRQRPREVDLCDLDRFLSEAAEEERLVRIADEPANQVARDGGRRGDKPVKREHQPAQKPPPTVLSTQAVDAKFECIACGQAHSVTSCSAFKRMLANERAQLAKSSGFCFKCLQGKHRAKDCQTTVACNVKNCSGRHHPLLHGAERVYPKRDGHQAFQAKADEQIEVLPGPLLNAIAPQSTPDVLLAVVPVKIRAGGRTLDTYALLDSGSQATLIRQDAVDALGIHGRRKVIRFGTFRGDDPAVETKQVDFLVASCKGDSIFPVTGAYVVPRLNVGQRRPACSYALQYLQDLAIPFNASHEVKVLLGMDVQDAHLITAVRRPPLGVHGPNAILTPFGWCAVGRVPENASGGVALPVVNHLHIEALQHLEEAVEQFWKTDSFPVREAPKTFAPPLELAALNQLRASIRHNGVRYEVCVPKRNDFHRLPDNRESVRRSFLALERRLIADEKLGVAVTSGMEENIRAGYAIPATPNGPNQKVWHLKYHPVRHPHKPDKVRVVFNAAARFNGVALNDVLLKGPDLTSQLLAVFLRFRERPVGVSADIARMFYQVLMTPEDTPLFRFFWRRPGSRDPLREFEMCVHIFRSVCSPAVCNFALQKLAEDAPEELNSCSITNKSVSILV